MALLVNLSGCNPLGYEAAEDATLAATLLDQRRLAEARLAIDRAIQAQDNEPEFFLIKARIEMTAGSPEGTYSAYQNVLALDGANLEALRGVSQYGLQLGYMQESLSATERILSLYPSDKDALLIQGLIALIKKRYAEALQHADKVLSIASLDEAGTILYARASFLSGDPAAAKSAIADYENAKTPSAGTVRTSLEIARAESDGREMHAAFAQLRRLMPDNTQAIVDQANFLYKFGDEGEARETLRGAFVRRDLPLEDLIDAVSIVAEYRTKFSSVDIDAIVRNGALKTRVMLARELVRQKDYSYAQMLLEGVKDTQAIAARASLRLAQGLTDSALADATAVLAVDPTHCEALTVQSQASFLRKRTNVAVASGRQATNECPREVEAWVATALAYANSADLVNARLVFRDGIAANPQNSRIVRAYVSWLTAIGNNREALAAARRLTNAAPALASGWELYVEICRKLEAPCESDAKRGLRASQTIYAIDLPPGELPPNGLFGRFMGQAQ